MISTREIYEGIEKAVREFDAEIFVTANRVVTSEENYIFVEIVPARKDIGFGYNERIIEVRLAVVFVADERAQKYHSELYEYADKLERAFSGYIKIGDRYITIYDTNYRIFDDVLNYRIELKYADAIDKLRAADIEYGDVMNELEIEWSDKNGNKL